MTCVRTVLIAVAVWSSAGTLVADESAVVRTGVSAAYDARAKSTQSLRITFRETKKHFGS
jgi:hypothetical protein